MDIEIKTTTEPKVAAEFLASRILEKLGLNKKVLWFVPGGSSIKVAAEAAKIISKNPHQNLAVMLTDERYGPVGFPDSNWQQLLDTGFSLVEAKLMPVLNGSAREETTENFNINLKLELERADYKIGLFGIGTDSHTAGILPESPAIESKEFAFRYNTEKFERITITPKTIVELDEAVVLVQGEGKWGVLENFKNKNVDLRTAPVQILKVVPKVTIFSDYPNK